LCVEVPATLEIDLLTFKQNREKKDFLGKQFVRSASSCEDYHKNYSRVPHSL